MGYRSDVAYKIWFESEDTRDAFIDLVLSNHDMLLYKALQECEIGQDQVDGEVVPIISFYANDVKWYEEYPDVKMHHDLLKFAELTFGDDGYCGARFVRMGESDDDCEADAYGNHSLIDFDDLYVRRELVHGDVVNPITLDQWREQQTQTT
jgi:hypothetical protein